MESNKGCKCTGPKSLEEVISKFSGESSSLIPCLQKVQEFLGYISKEAIVKISKGLNVPESEIYGVVSFYSQFRTTPPAKHTIDVCMGTACYVLGAGDVLNEFCDKLKINPNEISQDGKWLINTSRCLGCCGLAPVVTVDGKVFGKVKQDDVKKIISEYDN